MPFQLKAASDHCHLTLEGQLDIRDASSLWSALLPHLTGANRIVVGGASAGSLDSSILQILYIVQANSHSFELENPSSELLRSLQRAGLTKTFRHLQGEGHE